MIGAIIGDIIGSQYERHNIKTTDFPLYSPKARFTDDTVLTIAIADLLLTLDANPNICYQHEAEILRRWVNKYPHRGYGGLFKQWAISISCPRPYNSWGNGSAMRVSPVGFFYATLEDTLKEAKYSAAITHNHPEGIKGAQATAAAIFLARMGESKKHIKQYIENNFNYNLSRRIIDIRPTYRFDVSCQGTVPESIIAFLESDDFESAIRIAISLGGDSDTIACITGGIAQAFYKEIDPKLIQYAMNKLPTDMIEIIEKFATATGWQYT